MKRIVRSVAAFGDTRQIWRYIAKDDPQAATRQIERIDAKFRFLAGSPFAGTPHPELGRTLRSFAVGNYLIFYRPIPDGVRVVRVLNAARDQRRVFRR